MKVIFKYVKPYSRLYIGSVLFVVLAAMMNLLLPNSMKNIVNLGIENKDVGMVLQQGMIMLGITFLNLGFWFLASYFGAKASFRFARDLRDDVFRGVINAPISETDDIGTSSLITRTSSDIVSLEMISFRILRMGIISPISFIGSIALAFFINARLASIFLIAAPILFLVCYLILKKATPVFASIFPKTDGVNRVLRENLTGIRVVRAFNKDETEKARFQKANGELTDTNMKAQLIIMWLSPITTLLMNLVVLAIIYFGAGIIDSGNLLVGDIMALIQYATLILSSVMQLNSVFQMIPRTRVAVGRISELLAFSDDTSEEQKNTELNFSDSGIEFRDVSFAYKGSDVPVLSDISFKAESGKVTAIIGGTGSGKSTLAQLVLRFYDASKGNILVGNQDISKIDKSTLRSLIGYASQKTELFSGDIWGNVSYGNDGNTEDIMTALDVAQASEFVQGKEDTIHAQVAQGGKNFSGGQKQRLSIARAIARKSPILIIDDSFSALDFRTEKLLRKALAEHKKDVTMLIVAQRVASIMDADKIIVLNNGKIENTGTHKELIEKCDFYKQLVLSQLQTVEVM